MENELFGLATKEAVPVPLTGVTVRGDIAGRSARVKVIQGFQNQEKQAIEAIYKFPLPENSALCGFKALVGVKITEGKIEEREKAFELYDEALARGDGAYLLDQERPNIFTLSVGRLDPGEKATIEIEYVTLLETNGLETRFFLPTTISPRYIPDSAPDQKGIPVDHLVNPEYSLSVPYGLKLFLNIHNKKSIASVESPSHNNIRKQIDSSAVRVEFSDETVQMDHDFILTITYQLEFLSRGYMYRDDQEQFIQVDFSCDGGEYSSLSKKEIIFLLDCSGSMEGKSIREAKKALEIFLKGLAKDVRFNLFRFGSSYEKSFSQSFPYTTETVHLAQEWLWRIDADLGGTEILPPLKEIYSEKVPEDFERQVIVITDGQVGNEQEVIELVKENEKIRLFTIGIGYGPNEYFIRQLSRTGGGSVEMIAPGERIESKILRLFEKVMSGGIRDLKVNLTSEAEQAPFLPVVFPGEVITLFARLKADLPMPEKVLISGSLDGKPKEWLVTIEETNGKNNPIPLLWARERIRSLEEGVFDITPGGSQQVERTEKWIQENILGISRQYGVISRETSFIAIEKRISQDTLIPETVLRKVAVMLTKGWGGNVYQRGFYKLAHILSVPKIYADEETMPSRMDLSYMSSPVFLSRRVKSPEEKRYDLLMNILSQQKAEGGFEIDKTIVKLMGVSLSKIKKIARGMETKQNADNFFLLSTAIILSLLNTEFTDLSDIWGGVTQKTSVWFKNELLRVEPTIKGLKLEDWAKSFLEVIWIPFY